MSSEITFHGFPAHVAVKSAEAATDDAGTSSVIGDRIREIIRAHFGLTEVPADSKTFGHFATDWIDRLEINMEVEKAFNIIIDCALIYRVMSPRRTVGSFVEFVEGSIAA
jgi:acyl carrier protein